MGHTYIGVPNLGARWSRFLTVTLYDSVSAGIWVIHTYIHVCFYKFELTVDHLRPITACGMVSFSASSYLVQVVQYADPDINSHKFIL